MHSSPLFPRPVSDLELLFWLVVTTVGVTSTLLSYGALAIALRSRFRRRAPRKRNRRLPKMLRVAYRQGRSALVCVGAYVLFVVGRFVMERSHWNAAEVVEIYRDLAERVFRAFPVAAVVIVPFGVSWLWMRRLGQMRDRWQRV